jgi:hypothetical protein
MVDKNREIEEEADDVQDKNYGQLRCELQTFAIGTIERNCTLGRPQINEKNCEHLGATWNIYEGNYFINHVKLHSISLVSCSCTPAVIRLNLTCTIGNRAFERHRTRALNCYRNTSGGTSIVDFNICKLKLFSLRLKQCHSIIGIDHTSTQISSQDYHTPTKIQRGRVLSNGVSQSNAVERWNAVE